MRQISGTPFGLDKGPVVGKLTDCPMPISQRANYILIKPAPSLKDFGYAGYIFSASSRSRKGIQIKDGLSIEFVPGDIATLSNGGYISFVWENQDNSNALLVTEACNCHCIMCPQPPKPHDKTLLQTSYKILSLVDHNYSGDVCITGGEPTLLQDDFIRLLKKCREKLPNSFISILTNGKNFSNIELTRKIALLGLEKFIICVSMHSDVSSVHDKVVGKKGSLSKTQKGLHNLAKFRLPVEIRVVVVKDNYRELVRIAKHIHSNFPFAQHTTFMALEMTGEARKNNEMVWVDPWEYRSQLEEATNELHRRNMYVSVYNHQLCIIDKRTQRFARQSIASWKNIYDDICLNCDEVAECCGLFSTSNNQYSKHIHPIKHELKA